MPERSSRRAPTTSINKDSQGAGSESPASAGAGCGLRSGRAETRPGEEEVEEEEEEREEEEREERGEEEEVGAEEGGMGGRRLPGLGPARPAGRRGPPGQPRTGEAEEGAVPARWARAARPRSRSWRRRRTWFTAAWPAGARGGGGQAGPQGLGGGGGEGRAAGPPHPAAGPRQLPAPRLHFGERHTLKGPRRFPRARSGVPGGGPRRGSSSGGTSRDLAHPSRCGERSPT